MNSPANRLTHRDRAAAAGTDITLVGVRRGGFRRSKIAVNDLIVGVAPQAAAERALGADDLLAFACDQHPGVPCCARSAGTSTRAATACIPLLCNFDTVLTALSPRCRKHWWMGYFRCRSHKIYRSKHQRDQQCSNCHDDTYTGANTCRLPFDYLNTPANVFYFVL